MKVDVQETATETLLCSPVSTLTADSGEYNNSNNDTTYAIRPADMNDLTDDSRCLNDNIINVAQRLLSRQFRKVSGLKDTVAVAASPSDAMLASDKRMYEFC